MLPKYHPAAAGSVRNVSDLSQVKTVLGRGRAWIRFALIEKNLEEYLRVGFLLFSININILFMSGTATVPRKRTAPVVLV